MSLVLTPEHSNPQVVSPKTQHLGYRLLHVVPLLQWSTELSPFPVTRPRTAYQPGILKMGKIRKQYQDKRAPSHRDRITPYQIYLVYSLTHRQTLIDGQRDIFSAARDRMHQEDYFFNRDLPLEWGYCPLPLCSLCMNVPRIPKHSEPNTMAKLPSNIQTCRKVLHLEINKKDLEFVEHLVSFAKNTGIYSQWWGTHAHPTEDVDWNAVPGDIKHATKFSVLV